MKYKLNIDTVSSIFAVPSAVVDKHIKQCSEMQIKILLFLLRQPEQTAQTSQIAEYFSITEDAVISTVDYWIHNKILIKTGEAASSALSDTPVKTGSTLIDSIVKHERVKKPSKPPTARLTVSDVNNIERNNEEVSFLLVESERILSKTLTASDVSTIVGLYDWAGIPVDVILMVEMYCKSKDKTHLRYIEKTALSWFEKGIDSHEKAEKYISELIEISNNEKLVRSAFGIYDRKLITKEREYIHTWFYEYKFDIRLIKLAYEKTIESIQKLSFPYINSILKSWYEQGVKKPEDVAGVIKPAQNSAAASNTSYNLSEFEQMMRNVTPEIDI